MKTLLYSKYLLILLLFFSCKNNVSNNIVLNDFEKIDLIKFNKKKVKFKTNFIFLNELESSVTILNSDFDIIINGIDIASHINTNQEKVLSKKSISIPIVVEFKPSKVFKNYETEITKIKSDIIAEIKIIGFITIKEKSKKIKLEYSHKQMFLFSNNKNLYLNNKNEIINNEN